MRAVRIPGVNDVRVDEIEEPQPGPRDVIVRVRRCGLCGSDLGYIKVGGVAAPAEAPFGIGHELSGVIEVVGTDVVCIAPGQRVVVNPMGDGNGIGAGLPEGAFAPLLRVSNATLGGAIHPIPDHVDWDAAALAEPLGVALHAVHRSGAAADDKVAVFGVGPIGLGIVFFLKRAGVSSVVAIDRSPQRLHRARRLGADHVIDAGSEDVAAVLGDLHGRADLFGWPTVGTSLWFESSGAPSVLPSIVGMAPFHARAVMVAVHHEPIAIDWKMALGKEMSFITSMAYPDEFPEVIAAISEPRFDADAFISHRIPLSRFDDALAVARDAQASAKVMVACDA